MKKEETKAVVRLVRHMLQLQRELTKPTRDDATDREILKLFKILWEWTPVANQSLPSKHQIEFLVGLMRGLEPREYCYVSRQDVARIIRAESKNKAFHKNLSVIINKDADEMSDLQLYENGKWNYKPTPLVELLHDLHVNPRSYSDID